MLRLEKKYDLFQHNFISSSYLYFLKLLSKIHFKRVNWDLKGIIKKIIKIIVKNLKKFDEVIFKYYLLIIIKKIILQFDLTSMNELNDELNEV